MNNHFCENMGKAVQEIASRKNSKKFTSLMKFLNKHAYRECTLKDVEVSTDNSRLFINNRTT